MTGFKIIYHTENYCIYHQMECNRGLHEECPKPIGKLEIPCKYFVPRSEMQEKK